MKRLIENLLDLAVRPVSRTGVSAWWRRTGRAHRRAHAVTALLLIITVVTQAVPANATTCTTSGDNITIAANCIFDAGTYTFTGTLTINGGVTVTAASNVGNAQVVIISDSIDVQGSISANGTGSGPGSGPGAPTGAAGGGGYGGNGAQNQAVGSGGGPTYGSATAPTNLGSGGASADGPAGTGGGSVKLQATGTITIAGTITANGTNGSSNSGGGSGGSVWIDAGTLAGSGTVTANGGNGSQGANIGGGGGGGRVALLYTTDSSTITKTAYGGTAPSIGIYGGAGSIYMKAVAQSNGDLIIDNNNQTTGVNTTQVTTASQTFNNLTVRNAAKYVIPNTFTLTVASGGTFTVGGTVRPALTVNSGGTFNPPSSSFTSSNVDITNNGTFGIVTDLTVGPATTFTQNSAGSFGAGLSTLTVGNGGSGVFSQSGTGTISATTVTVNSGGTLTHNTNTTTRVNVLDINATTLTVNSGGVITADGKGFIPNSGTGAPTGAAGGGGYGGNGAQNQAVGFGGGPTYGSLTAPTDIGSGGGTADAAGGTGGGAIKLTVSGTLTNNNLITANGTNGASNAGGGSGGSIWLNNIGTLAGSGTVTANGGTGSQGANIGGGGGGGRVAITYTSDSSTWTKQVFGGTSPSIGFHGGAGTLYLKASAATNGELLVSNNNNSNGVSTTQVAGASFTFASVTVNNGSKYVIVNTSAITIASGGTFTSGGSVRPNFTVNSGGTFNPPSSSFTSSNVDITNNGTFGIVTDLTVGPATTFTQNSAGSFGAGLSTLTVGNGGSGVFSQSGTGTISATTVTVNSGGTLTHNTNTTTRVNVLDINATTVTVNSGGTIDVNGKGFTPGNGPGTGTAAGAGAGYGGVGGANNAVGTGGGPTYGSAAAPTDLGSGGNVLVSVAGIGGGAIKLTVSGTITVNGSVTANGTNATNNAGGGSGGSIWFNNIGTLAGSGTITANGGSGSESGNIGGGGGGGRISIFYGSNSSTTSRTVTGGTVPVGGNPGAAGTITFQQTSGPPAVTSVTHTPASPQTTDPVSLSGTATDDTGVTKIEIYLDGTAPANLKHTCNFSPATTPANCAINVGALAYGAHTTTVRAYDAAPSSTDGAENFNVSGSTLAGNLILGRSKAGVTTSFALSFGLQGTSTGTLTVTFPAGFTVLTDATGGASSGCLSSFGHTAQTLTATKTTCSGTVILGGATVTNPVTPGFYKIIWTNDHGEGGVYIVDDDQVTVSGDVEPQLTFNVGSQTAACDGTFSGSGGGLGLGVLTASAVASSDVSSVPHVCARVTSNAGLGAIVSVRSAFGALQSAAVPADQILSSTATLVAGTAGYGMCAGSSGGDSGRDTTTPAGATPAATAPFNGSCSTSAHSVGGLTASFQTLWSVSGPSQNAYFRIFLKAAVSPATPAHADYADTLTFIATGTY